MRKIKRHINSMRRSLVHSLLGNELAIQKINTPVYGYKYRLIDLKRRIPYSDWVIVEADDQDFKLSRLPASQP